jgi:hypothetical protein
MTDPLAILREDTYTNEETNEMVGAMTRKQHLMWENFPSKDETQVFPLKNGKSIELNGRTRKAYDVHSGNVLFSFENMSIEEFKQILSNYEKE